MLTQLLAIQIVTFIAIIFLLRFLFSRHLNNALERLNTLHEENLIKEEELNDELKRAKEESQAQIQRGKDEAAFIIEEARKEANRLRLSIEDEAKAQSLKIVADGAKEAEKLKEKVYKDIQGQAVEMALKMVAELFTETDKIALQYQFANEIILEIERLPKEQFNVQSTQVKVISSYPLLDRQRQQLQEVLAAKTGATPQIKEEIDATLIGGLILEMGGMVIDGTLKNKLRRIIPYLK